MNRKKMILFLILAVILGSALGVGGTLGVQKIFFSGETTEAKAVPKKEGPVIPMGEFTVNLQGGSFLKATIAVEGTDAKAEEALKAKEPFIKDRINTVLSSKSMKDMQPAVRETLKSELATQLNDVTGNKIQSVLFLSFVYQ